MRDGEPGSPEAGESKSETDYNVPAKLYLLFSAAFGDLNDDYYPYAQFVSIGGGNSFTNNESYGLLTYMAVDSSEIRDNVIQGNRDAGVLLLDSETTVDDQAISGWARVGVALATELGIIKGFPDKSFQPAATATRAQSATMLVRMKDIIVKSS